MTNPYSEIIKNLQESDEKTTEEFNKNNKDPLWMNIAEELKFLNKRVNILSLAFTELLKELEEKLDDNT